MCITKIRSLDDIANTHKKDKKINACVDKNEGNQEYKFSFQTNRGIMEESQRGKICV